jgi:hypothetical protein
MVTVRVIFETVIERRAGRMIESDMVMHDGERDTGGVSCHGPFVDRLAVNIVLGMSSPGGPAFYNPPSGTCDD